jgi:hypothetical protein
MKRLLFLAVLAVAAWAGTAATSYAGSFGLFYRHNCNACSFCVRPYNAFSGVTCGVATSNGGDCWPGGYGPVGNWLFGSGHNHKGGGIGHDGGCGSTGHGLGYNCWPWGYGPVRNWLFGCGHKGGCCDAGDDQHPRPAPAAVVPQPEGGERQRQKHGCGHKGGGIGLDGGCGSTGSPTQQPNPTKPNQPNQTQPNQTQPTQPNPNQPTQPNPTQPTQPNPTQPKTQNHGLGYNGDDSEGRGAFGLCGPKVAFFGVPTNSKGYNPGCHMNWGGGPVPLPGHMPPPGPYVTPPNYNCLSYFLPPQPFPGMYGIPHHPMMHGHYPTPHGTPGQAPVPAKTPPAPANPAPNAVKPASYQQGAPAYNDYQPMPSWYPAYYMPQPYYGWPQ